PQAIEAEAARIFRLGPTDTRPVHFDPEPTPDHPETEGYTDGFYLGGGAFLVSERASPPAIVVRPVALPRWTAAAVAGDGAPEYLHVVETADAALAANVLRREASFAEEGTRLLGDPYVVGRSTEPWLQEPDEYGDTGLYRPAPRPTAAAVR